MKDYKNINTNHDVTPCEIILTCLAFIMFVGLSVGMALLLSVPA